MVKITLIDATDVKDIAIDLLLPNGKLKLLSYKEYEKYSWEEFRVFCHQYARYGIPTIELVNSLKKLINGRSAIEIGSGPGDLGYHMGIPMTDSKKQKHPKIKSFYEKMQQPIIEYPDDVEELEALDAVKKYKPQVVIGSWITTFSPIEVSYPSSPYGIKEDKILEQVETFILVGNLEHHGKKPILKSGYAEVNGSWIKSRAQNPKDNRIFILDNRNFGINTFKEMKYD